MRLYNDLQGYNTGWCTAGSKNIARDQICGVSSYDGGDFYVYYTKNKNGDYKIPRIAIRMENDCIGEIRGIEINTGYVACSPQKGWRFYEYIGK